jgi:cyclopropane fatty-acyl-phospholipid synthase-like methyltransferase
VKNILLKVRKLIFKNRFQGTENYWKRRYNSGGNSGAGSYNKLAEFKAEVLNKFVQENNIQTILEFGSGDGNQLRYAVYPSYIGFDISKTAVDLCKQKYKEDTAKSFLLVDEYKGQKAQLTMSLDVIFHLIEDELYFMYMHRLFSASEQYVAIYASNTDDNSNNHEIHVKHRKFSSWIEENASNWKLIDHIPNKYPYKAGVKGSESSFADFYFYKKME